MKFAVFFTALFLSGCVTLQSPVPMYTAELDRPAVDVAMLLNTQAEKCWSRGTGFFSDGLDVSQYYRQEKPLHFVIYVRRYAHDMGTVDTFLRIEVKENESVTQIVASEGEYTLGRYVGFYKDVEKWVSGDLECVKR